MTDAPNGKLRSAVLVFSTALIFALIATVWFSPLVGAQETPTATPTGDLVVAPGEVQMGQTTLAVGRGWSRSTSK